MDEIDKQRREEFKEYELKKKAEEDHRLAQMPDAERDAEKHKLDESKKRHNEHEKLKHPGGREALEEVWEETDKVRLSASHVSCLPTQTDCRWTRRTLTRAPSLRYTTSMVTATGQISSSTLCSKSS